MCTDFYGNVCLMFSTICNVLLILRKLCLRNDDAIYMICSVKVGVALAASFATKPLKPAIIDVLANLLLIEISHRCGTTLTFI